MALLTRRARREATERALGFLGWKRLRKALVGGLLAGASSVAAQLPTIDWSQLTVEGGAARLVLTIASSFVGATGVYWTTNAEASPPPEPSGD